MEMPTLNLLPGDKYDGRCAEIYITEKQFLIYHCSACEEIFTTFAELLSHITKDHFENTKELSKADIKSVQNVNEQETNEKNQFSPINLHVKERKPNNDFETKIDNKKEEQPFNQFSLCGFREAIKEKNSPEKMTQLLWPSKSLSQRKKLLKNNTIGRGANVLAHCQTTHNDERKYVCAICGFAFKEKYNLRGHLLRHSNQKHISCSICSKKLFTKVELCLHEYRHKSERQYVCGCCGMGFIRSVSLTQHLRKRHSQLLKCDQCLKNSSSFYQIKDYTTLKPDICAESGNEKSVENHKELPVSKHNSGKELFVKKNKTSIKEGHRYKHMQSDNLRETIIEGEFFLEQNSDEYELVQTLSDLECSKHV